MSIKEILNTYKTVAVYGISSNFEKAAYTVPEFLDSKGYNIIPINPTADSILGKRVYKKLIDVEEEIEILDVFRPSEQTLQVVKEAIERKQKRGDIKVIWLQEGIYNEDAKNLALENGFEFVQDKCIKIEYLRFNY